MFLFVLFTFKISFIKKIETVLITSITILLKSQNFDKFLAFFDSFLDVPSAALQLTPILFSKWKVLRSYTYQTKFIDFRSAVFGICCFWKGFFTRIPQNGLFKKKCNQGRGLSTWDFQGYWRKNMWKFQASIKKKVKFPGVCKNKPCNFNKSWFFTLKFPRRVTQFCRISRGERLKFLTAKWQN